MIITIDGPSGTGKSTIAKKLAEVLGIAYFDTGALYRAVSWKMIQEGVQLHDHGAVAALLKAFPFHMQVEGGEIHYFVGAIDVTRALRSPEVTAIVSAVSALKKVREALKPLQLQFAEGRDVVFEGRDMGTVVFPYAKVKVFLTARLEVRAKRRQKELQEKFPERLFPLESLMQQLEERDRYDSSRDLAPLQQAEGALLIDTSDLTLEEVVCQIKERVRAPS